MDFDFDSLQQRIETAAKAAFTEMTERCRNERIYAFALYSDDGVMTVCPAMNTLEHLEEADPDDRAYYQFEPAEWKYVMEGAGEQFDAISFILRDAGRGLEDEAFVRFSEQLFETCIRALENLKREDFFKTVSGRDIFLLFSLSDGGLEATQTKQMITRLNDGPYREEYLTWIDTWEDR